MLTASCMQFHDTMSDAMICDPCCSFKILIILIREHLTLPFSVVAFKLNICLLFSPNFKTFDSKAVQISSLLEIKQFYSNAINSSLITSHSTNMANNVCIETSTNCSTWIEIVGTNLDNYTEFLHMRKQIVVFDEILMRNSNGGMKFWRIRKKLKRH